MKVAIIGSGISGMTAAYYLNKKYDITLFEKRDRIGGHTATKSISFEGSNYNIDTGFIVFNDRTYPNFIKLMNDLDVSFSETTMGFSVSCQHTGLEYSGANLNTIFAQRKNLFSPSFLRLLKDIVRFNKQAQKEYRENAIPEGLTLGEYLESNKYSHAFSHFYLVPMGAAIWSASFTSMKQFPVEFFIKFFFNHGLLDITNRPKWRVIDGGSHSYIEPLTHSYKNKIEVNADIVSVRRDESGVIVTMKNGDQRQFDKIVFACHSDQALNLLGDASELENEILRGIPYQNNSVVLHHDDNMLPKNKRTWSSWNYSLRENPATEHKSKSQDGLPVLTYNMNILQHIKSDTTFCVTLNADEDIDNKKILGKYEYAHPQFSLSAMKAQQRWDEINDVNNTLFCGAYWANGFHEDGVVSAINVAKKLGVDV